MDSWKKYIQVTILFLSFLFLVEELEGQSESFSQKVEALTGSLNDTKDPERRLSIHKELDDLLRFSDTEKCYLNAKSALRVANKLEDSNARVYWLNAIGKAHAMSGKYLNALDSLYLAADLGRAIKDTLLPYTYNNLGIIHRDIGDMETAMNYFQTAIELNNSKSLPASSFYPFLNVADLFRRREEYSRSKHFLEEGLEVAYWHNNNKMKAYGFGAFAYLYVQKEKPDSAILLATKSLSFSSNQTFAPYTSIEPYINLSRAHALKGNYQLAISFAKKAISIAEEVNTLKNVVRGEMALTEIYILQNRYKEALILSNSILDKLPSLSFLKENYQVHQLIEAIYQKQGLYKEAYYQKLQVDSIEEKIFDLESGYAIALSERKIDLKIKSNENDQLKESLLSNAARLRMSNAFGVIIALLSLVTLIVIYSTFKESKFNNLAFIKDELNQSDEYLKLDYAKQLTLIAMVLLIFLLVFFYYWNDIPGIIGVAIAEFVLLAIIYFVIRKKVKKVYYISIFSFYPLVVFGSTELNDISSLSLAIVAIYIINSFLAPSGRIQLLNIILALGSFVLCNILSHLIEPVDPFPMEIFAALLSIISITVVILTVIFFNRNILDFKKENWQNNAFLRQITNLNPNFIFAKNTDRNYILANETMAKKFGLSKVDFIGKTQEQYYKGENVDLEKIKEDDLKVLNNGETVMVGEEIITNYNGQEIWLNTIKKPIFNSENQVVGILGVSSDITEKRIAEMALHKSKEKFKNLVDASPSGIVTTDLEGNLTFVSSTALEIFGYAKDEKINQNLKDFIVKEDHVRIEEYFQLLFNGKTSVNAQMRCINSEGKSFVCEGNCKLVRDESGYIKELLIVFNDITGKIKQQQIINQQLVVLNKKNKELERYIESNMELENFAYVASHDLRAPIRTVISFSQLLARSLGDRLTEKEREYMKFIVSSSSNMNDLINALLDYSRVNNTKINFEKINLGQIVSEVIMGLDATINEKKAVVNLEDLPAEIVADQTKIKQVFQNLISNALKFSKPNTTPEVSIGAIERGAEWIFWVKDNGIGISPEFHQKIFALFKRLHSIEDYDGVGIGLALCKKITEQHNGRIWVDSKVDQGTTFYFSILKQGDETEFDSPPSSTQLSTII